MASAHEGDRRALRGARLRRRFWKTSRRRPQGLDPPVVDLPRITEGGLEREVVVKLPSDHGLRSAPRVCPTLHGCCTRATVGVRPFWDGPSVRCFRCTQHEVGAPFAGRLLSIEGGDRGREVLYQLRSRGETGGSLLSGLRTPCPRNGPRADAGGRRPGTAPPSRQPPLGANAPQPGAPFQQQGSWVGRGFGGGFGASIGWLLGSCLVFVVLCAVLIVGCAALIAAGSGA